MKDNEHEKNEKYCLLTEQIRAQRLSFLCSPRLAMSLIASSLKKFAN